jgi:bacteriorhodopsin
MIDSTRLQQILLNLISNAIKVNEAVGMRKSQRTRGSLRVWVVLTLFLLLLRVVAAPCSSSRVGPRAVHKVSCLHACMVRK